MSLLAHELVGKINVDTHRGVENWRGIHRAEGAPAGGPAWDAAPSPLSTKEQDEADTLQ